MLYVCVRGVMDVVFSVCIVTRGAVGARIWEVMQRLYVCVFCASCVRSQCCILHDLQFVNADRGCKRRQYGRGILKSWSHNLFIGSHECIRLFATSCCCECFYHL